ncbi:MAG TPA: hypothetical protein VGL89_19825 [Candidatus Koribacter sp.]|jgi:hypothetical protein
MPRLGDTIDDNCSRCKRTMDHSIQALAGDEPVKVVCRTCSFEHKYRGNKTGKKEPTKEEAFNKLLAQARGQLGMEQEKPKRKK